MSLSQAGSDIMARSQSVKTLAPINTDHSLPQVGTLSRVPTHQRITVQDMVSSNNKNKGPFGIEGYNIPMCQHPYQTLKYSVPKQKGNNFVDIMSGVTKHNPGPGTHEIKMEWIKPGPKAAKGAKKNSYIDQVVEYELKYKWPSSHTYEPKKVMGKVHVGPIDKAEGFDFMSDVQFCATQTQSPQNKDCNPNINTVLPRFPMMVNYKNTKAPPKGWKLQKSNAPSPGQYDNGKDKAFTLTMSRSSVFTFSKEKRKVYAEQQADLKKHVPSPMTYDMGKVREDKVYKRISTKRF